MTGAPAETWRKFRFSTAPAWAYAFLILLCTGVGLLIVFVAMYLVSRRASGHLPLTRASSHRVGLATWIPGGALLGGIVLLIAAAVVAGANSNTTTGESEVGGAIAGDLAILGILALLAGIVGALVLRQVLGPRARVMDAPPGHTDRLVELRNVHPAFVAAVLQVHQARAAQYATSYQSQPPPLPPGSN
jgi:hypothetical protein